MTTMGWLDGWDGVLAGGNAAAIEEFWLARLDEGVGDGTLFVEALRHLRGANRKNLVATLLELAADEAEAESAWQARRLFLSELLRMGIGDGDAHRKNLETCVRHLWAGRPSLQRILDHFRLQAAKKPLETLDEIETWLEFDVGGVFLMSGKGPGRVVEVNPQVGVLRLDLEKEKKVPVPIGAAAKYLTPLPPEHFLRRRLEDRAALAAEVKGDPLRGVELVLAASSGPLTVGELRALLDGVVQDLEWPTWWNRAKKHPRLVAAGSGTRVQYRLAAEHGVEDELRAAFDRGDPVARLDLARRQAGRFPALDVHIAETLVTMVERSQLPADRAWDATDLALRLGTDAGRVAAARRALVSGRGAAAVLDSASDVAQREAVLAFLAAQDAAAYPATALAWLERESHPRVISRLVDELLVTGEAEKVRTLLDQVFLHPQRMPALFVWALEAAPEGAYAALVEDRLGGALLVRLVELVERREFAHLRARLKDVVSPRGLAGRILAERLTADQARRIIQVLESPGEMAEERAWVRRAVAARFPELRQGPVAEVIPALAATVERLQAELRQLKEKEIPETLKAIQVAKEHGDLRENFEYHSARARQELLSARAAKIMDDLSKVRVVDPATVDTSVVRVGTRVTLRPVDAPGPERLVTILGPFEGDPDRGIVSAGSDAALALLDRAAGDVVSFAGERAVIASIAAATDL